MHFACIANRKTIKNPIKNIYIKRNEYKIYIKLNEYKIENYKEA